MKVVDCGNEYEKLCHARPGDLVRFVDSELNPEGNVYLVALPLLSMPASWKSHGLYATEGVLLINVETGHPKIPPNMSSRAIIYRNAEVNLKEK